MGWGSVRPNGCGPGEKELKDPSVTREPGSQEPPPSTGPRISGNVGSLHTPPSWPASPLLGVFALLQGLPAWPPAPWTLDTLLLDSYPGPGVQGSELPTAEELPRQRRGSRNCLVTTVAALRSPDPGRRLPFPCGKSTITAEAPCGARRRINPQHSRTASMGHLPGLGPLQPPPLAVPVPLLLTSLLSSTAGTAAPAQERLSSAAHSPPPGLPPAPLTEAQHRPGPQATPHQAFLLLIILTSPSWGSPGCTQPRPPWPTYGWSALGPVPLARFLCPYRTKLSPVR